MIKTLIPTGLRASTTLTVFCWGLLFNLLITIVQTGLYYERERQAINDRVIDHLEKSLPGLATSVYNINDVQLGIQLDNLMYDPAVVYAQISEKRGNEMYYFNRGKPEAEYDFVVERPLKLRISSGQEQYFGHTVIFCSYKDLYQALLRKGLESLLSNTLIALLLCGVIMTTISRTLLRHLEHISRASENISIAELSTPIKLRRSKAGIGRPDEIDRLVAAINYTRIALQEEINNQMPQSIRSGAIQLNQSDEINDLFHRDSSERVIRTALNNSKIYKCAFGAFAIKLVNYEAVAADVGNDVVNRAVQVFAQRLQHKLKNALQYVSESTYNRSTMARIDDDAYLAVIQGITTKVNAVSVCKRIEDVANMVIEIGARDVKFDVHISAVTVCYTADAEENAVKDHLMRHFYNAQNQTATTHHIGLLEQNQEN